MRTAIKDAYTRHLVKKAEKAAERKLADLPDRLRDDVGLAPARNGINDWMYDSSLLWSGRG